MSEPTKDELRIIINVTEEPSYGSGAYLKVDAHFVYNTPEGLLNPSSGSWDRSPYADLGLTGQLDVTSATRSNDFYGRDVEYRNVYSVDLRTAEVMVKTLRQVNRYIEKSIDNLGAPDTGMHIALLANAVGIKTPCPFARRTRERRSYNDSQYTWMNTNALRDWLNMQVGEFCKKHNVVKEPDPAVIGLQRIRDDL